MFHRVTSNAIHCCGALTQLGCRELSNFYMMPFHLLVQVVQERLAEQEEERDARQRLEDIINMCANFVSGSVATPATTNGHSPSNRSSQLKSPPGSRKSPPSTIGIKTNGSLKATTPSSEDELAAINNVADSAARTPASPTSPPQSPRNRIKTVPGIPSPKVCENLDESFEWNVLDRTYL